METLSKERVELAIELIESGRGFMLGDVGLYLDKTEKNKIFVSFGSSWQPENMTKRRANEDLFNAKEIVKALKEMFPVFSEYLSSKNVVYRILYNYGKGGYEICFEIDGKMQYVVDLPE